MFSESINLLKKNPVIVLFCAGFMALFLLVILIFYPSNLSQFTRTGANQIDFVAYCLTLFKLMVASFLMFSLGILFISGFGNMIAEAIQYGKTSAASFIPGLKKYFVRIMLSGLLMTAISFAFLMILSFIMIFIGAFITIANGATNTYSTGIILAFIIMFLDMASLPFIILWIPSIFIDDSGVIQSLKNGLNAGIKNYKKLIEAIFILYIPVFANVLMNQNSMTNGSIFSLSYFVWMVIEAIIAIIIVPIIYMIYKEYRQKGNV